MKWLYALPAVVCLCAPGAGATTFLVLPFFNASDNANIDWIGESISETISEALAKQQLMSIQREDRLEAYRRLGVRPGANLTRATVIRIGQALDVERVIYGDFNFAPPPEGQPLTRGSLRVTAHVLDLKRMQQGPEFVETGPLDRLGAVQRRLAWQTLQFVDPASAPAEAEFNREWPLVRVDASENYIRGLLATVPVQKEQFFSRAVKIEPSYSQACYQLGMLAYAKQDYKTAAEWLEKVATTDVHYRYALFHLGVCRFYEGDYAGAKTAFEQVAKEVPLNEVYNNLGAAESRLNDPAALDSFKKAIEGDPSDPTYHFNLGYALWKQGQFNAAADSFRAALDRDPEDAGAITMLGRCLKRSGPAASSVQSEGSERLKTNYEESAYFQLKAVLQGADKKE
jgi:tetratricopeptide (TPR) repeat protein